MRRQVRMILMVLGWLIAGDLLVAGVLGLKHPALAGLERYFYLGTSVPGKLALWRAEPARRDNLGAVGWIPDVAAASSEAFAAEEAGTGPVVRGYGMSFVNNILNAARDETGLRVDLHSGPAAPPNWTYAAFLADAGNRRAGDVAVLGVLSSSVPSLVAMSNRTANFEQPAPLTFPIFRAAGPDGLERVDPLVRSREDEAALATDPAARAAWAAQLAREDGLYTPEAFGLPVLDASPFARLVRRSLATSAIGARERAVLSDPEAWVATLTEICRAFAAEARAEGLVPVVMLVQGRGSPDLAGQLAPALEAGGVPYFATGDYVDVSDPSRFLADGHYLPGIDAALARAFTDRLRELQR